MKRHIAVGLDIGGTHVRIGSQNRSDEMFAFEKAMRSDVIDSKDSGKSLAAFIDDYLHRHNLIGEVSALVAGFPSTISLDRRTILQTPNIPAMNNVPMADILEEIIHIPVFLERDVNLIYEHDRREFELSCDGIGIGIYFGTGIGNAIFIDGKPLLGCNGCAGELGHIPVIGRTEICGCKNPGCSECYASGIRLVALQNEYFPETPIKDSFVKQSNNPVVRELIDAMACVVASEINILNPIHVILGGGLLDMTGFPRDYFEERILIHVRKPYPASTVKIFYARESQQSGVLGALLVAKSIINRNKNTEGIKC